MPTHEAVRNRGAVLAGVLFVAWALAAAAMLRSNARDPFDVTRVGTARYGHNHEGALVDGLAAISFELLVACGVLGWWSRRPGPLRAALGLGLAVPIAMMSAMLSMHAGGIVMVHLLFVVVVGVFFSALSVGALGSGRR